MPSILTRLNAQPALAVAAAANPLLALEDLGYAIDPKARPQIADRLRFGAAGALKLNRLRERIWKEAGHPFDLASADELHRILFVHLKLGSDSGESLPASALGPLPVATAATAEPGAAGTDPLEAYRGAHRITQALLDYRRLEASQPRLASRELYDQIKQGKPGFPVARLVWRLQAQTPQTPAQEEQAHA